MGLTGRWAPGTCAQGPFYFVGYPVFPGYPTIYIALNMREAILLITALFAASTSATEECANTASHAEQRACLEALAKQTAAEVAAAQDAVRERIANWDEEEQYKSKSRKLLADSNKHFAALRASQCDLEASSAAGGNGAGDLRLDCQIRLNRNYVAELKRRWGMF